MHKNYEYPFILQWFNHKHNSQQHKTLSKDLNANIQMCCQPNPRLVFHKVEYIKILIIFH
jgi:hypothetical protein